MSFFLFFLKKFLEDISPFRGATCFRLLVMSPLGLKPEWTGVTHSLRVISGVTPDNLLTTSMAVEPFCSTYLQHVQAGIGGARNLDLNHEFIIMKRSEV